MQAVPAADHRLQARACLDQVAIRLALREVRVERTRPDVLGHSAAAGKLGSTPATGVSPAPRHHLRHDRDVHRPRLLQLRLVGSVRPRRSGDTDPVEAHTDSTASIREVLAGRSPSSSTRRRSPVQTTPCRLAWLNHSIVPSIAAPFRYPGRRATPAARTRVDDDAGHRVLHGSGCHRHTPSHLEKTGGGSAHRATGTRSGSYENGGTGSRRAPHPHR